jgi:uncharacterized protein YoxC
MDAAQILVIILATALALFLILAIALVIYLIKIARQIKRITNAAENAAEKFDDIMSVARKAAGPALAAKLMASIAGRFMSRRRRER